MSAYYNEIDPAACAVLRELIARGVIAHGVVDAWRISGNAIVPQIAAEVIAAYMEDYES